jgi:hypothetical protein
MSQNHRITASHLSAACRSPVLPRWSQNVYLDTKHHPSPGPRLESSSYVHDIVSEMPITNSLKRAELIEVAVKVPKELIGKKTGH